MAAVESVRADAWWKEPSRDQWYAFVAAWLGWTLDAFDFTIFLLIMVPIAHVPLTAVAIGPETKGTEMAPELVVA